MADSAYDDRLQLRALHYMVPTLSENAAPRGTATSIAVVGQTQGDIKLPDLVPSFVTRQAVVVVMVASVSK